MREWKTRPAPGLPVGKGETAVKFAKSGLLTKILILVLLVTVVTSLLEINSQLDQALVQLETDKQNVAAQTQVNAELADAIEHSGDLDRKKDVAREKLGLVEPGEIIFVPVG